MAESGVFQNVTKQYPEIQAEFIRMGLFDANGLITEPGRAFWQEFLTPSPTALNGTVSGVKPTTTGHNGHGGGHE